jgi:hypothetical protein
LGYRGSAGEIRITSPAFRLLNSSKQIPVLDVTRCGEPQSFNLEVVKIGSSWRYMAAAYGPNGKIKPDVVIVDGSHQFHPEGNYYLRLSAGNGSLPVSVSSKLKLA